MLTKEQYEKEEGIEKVRLPVPTTEQESGPSVIDMALNLGESSLFWVRQHHKKLIAAGLGLSSIVFVGLAWRTMTEQAKVLPVLPGPTPEQQAETIAQTQAEAIAQAYRIVQGQEFVPVQTIEDTDNPGNTVQVIEVLGVQRKVPSSDLISSDGKVAVIANWFPGAVIEAAQLVKAEQDQLALRHRAFEFAQELKLKLNTSDHPCSGLPTSAACAEKLISGYYTTQLDLIAQGRTRDEINNRNDLKVLNLIVRDEVEAPTEYDPSAWTLANIAEGEAYKQLGAMTPSAQNEQRLRDITSVLGEQ